MRANGWAYRFEMSRREGSIHKANKQGGILSALVELRRVRFVIPPFAKHSNYLARADSRASLETVAALLG
jgi:hypothetical protein